MRWAKDSVSQGGFLEEVLSEVSLMTRFQQVDGRSCSRQDKWSEQIHKESEPDLAVVKQTMTEENKHSGDTQAFSDVPPGLLSREATRGRAP